MSQDSVWSELEIDLLGSPSSLELAKEISETQETHQKLLDFSKQTTTLILPEDQDHSEMDPTEIPLPPQTEQEVNDLLQPSTSSGVCWTREQRLTLQENLVFHQGMILDLENIQKQGPTGKLPKLPTRPKRKLANLYGGKTKKAKTTMTPGELHEYLMSKIVDIRMKVRKEVFFEQNITSLKSAIEKLREGYRQITRQEATSMAFNLNYGCLLELVFKIFEAERKKTNSEQTWDEWLKENVGISSTYSRRLREIARLLEPYKSKFSTVGLSFYEIFNMKKELHAMFDHSEEIRNYWAEKIPSSIAPDFTQQSSQEIQE